MAHLVTIYEGGLVRAMHGDGERWNFGVAKRIELRAIAKAPSRSGGLKAAHDVEQHRGSTGRFETGFTVVNRSPYAAYVHGGTGIYGPSGAPITYLRPVGPLDGLGPRFIRSQRGQRAQPWLRQAAMEVLGTVG